MIKKVPDNHYEKGFSLIELTITNAIMIIVFGVVISMFMMNKQKLDYESDKSMRLSELLFATTEITSELRSKVSYPWSHIETLQPVNDANATQQIAFKVYDPKNSFVAPYTVIRRIIFQNNEIYLSKKIGTPNHRLMSGVTFFKVFDDSITPRGGFQGIPKPLPNKTLMLPNGVSSIVHGYTILIEVSIPIRVGIKSRNNKDVRSVVVTGNEKRLWRYYQLYPGNGNIF